MSNTVVKIPQLGESVSEGTIGRWLKNLGDRVELDEPLVEIQTDKVNAEVPSPVAGILQQILLPEGTTAAVTSDLAIIGDESPAPAQSSGALGSQSTSLQPTPAERTSSAAPAAVPEPARTLAHGETATPSGPPRQLEPSTPGWNVDATEQGDPDLIKAGTQQSVRAPQADSDAKRFYTPVVLRMAEEHAIDLNMLQGTGAHGRVTRKDVERAIAEEQRGGVLGAAASDRLAGPALVSDSGAPVGGSSGGAAPAAHGGQLVSGAPAVGPTHGRAPAGVQPMSTVATVPAANSPLASAAQERALTPMRRAIAEHMARARTEIPDAWSLVEIDLTNLVRQRQALQAAWQASEGYELTYLPFFIKAVVAGLLLVPELNAAWAGDHVTLFTRHHLGIAVSLENGLVVPVMRDADQLSVAGIARALRRIVQKARGGKLAPEDLQGATFTVNNPGSLGSIMSQPIIPLGQAGIVTMEAIVKRPVVLVEDAIAVRSMMNCCLSFDHRILDGAGALTFLRELKRQLETVQYPLY